MTGSRARCTVTGPGGGVVLTAAVEAHRDAADARRAAAGIAEVPGRRHVSVSGAVVTVLEATPLAGGRSVTAAALPRLARDVAAAAR